MSVKLDGLISQCPCVLNALFGQAKHKAGTPGQLDHTGIVWLLPAISRLGAVNQVDPGGRLVFKPGQQLRDGLAQGPGVIGRQLPAFGFEDKIHSSLRQDGRFRDGSVLPEGRHGECLDH